MYLLVVTLCRRVLAAHQVSVPCLFPSHQCFSHPPNPTHALIYPPHPSTVPQTRHLSASLAASQRDSLTLRGRCLELQHQVTLLGGDLQGRLSLAQGSVVSELQQQLGARDEAISASQTRLQQFDRDLDRLSNTLAAKLSAERRERERLGAEAAQARLLCAARGRRAAQLQKQVEELQAQLERAQGGEKDRLPMLFLLARALFV